MNEREAYRIGRKDGKRGYAGYAPHTIPSEFLENYWNGHEAGAKDRAPEPMLDSVAKIEAAQA